MNDDAAPSRLGRRQFLRWGGGAAALAGAGTFVARWRGGALNPAAATPASAAVVPPMPAGVDMYIGGTDGWINLPGPAVAPYHPDVLAPAPYTDYIFGFRNITDMSDAARSLQKNRAQATAPLFFLDQFDPAQPKDFKVAITNLGLAQRPDLFDAHTLHWHGFRNVIPFFDGEPTGSVSVPAGSVFTYVYRPRDPGTYMYHCHVEDVEHVHMGMTGMVFVRALQNKYGVPARSVPIARLGGNTAAGAPMGYAYNDGDGSTAYDREYSMMLTEVWAEAHWADAHIQLPEWSDYHPDFSLLNGRIWPDTIAPGAPLVGGTTPPRGKPYVPVQTTPSGADEGELEAATGNERLRRQPLSSLVECNAGDRVLLRFANLGFKEAAMTTAGLKLKVVGKDATPMRGRDGTDTSFTTNTVSMGAGESCDAIFVAPPKTGPGYDTYLLYNRNLTRGTGSGAGGQRTEIRVYAAGTVPAQTYPNYSY